MSAYKVFIAYKGSKYGKRVARSVDQCLWNHGIKPKIALGGTRGEIKVDNQEDIFREIARCQVLVAVSVKGRTRTNKFRDEILLAKYDLRPSKPIIALVQKKSRPLLSLKEGVDILQFSGWRDAKTCQDLLYKVRRQFKLITPPPAYGNVGQALRRRNLNV